MSLRYYSEETGGRSLYADGCRRYTRFQGYVLGSTDDENPRVSGLCTATQFVSERLPPNSELQTVYVVSILTCYNIVT